MNTEELLINTMAVAAVQEAKLLAITEILGLLVEKDASLKSDLAIELPSLNVEIMGSFDNFECGDPIVNRKVSEMARKIYLQNPIDF